MLTQHLKLPGSRPTRILVGDIGATCARLAICSLRDGHVLVSRQETYSSAEHASLTAVLEVFLRGEHQDVEAACLGVPAPIHSGVVFPLTNLPWRVDREQVIRVVGTDQVTFINDVEASAAGIPDLSPDDLVCLQAGQADPAGNRVVVSVGTGLGVSVLTPIGRVFATEAGHATFSPSRDPDFELRATLAREHGHVSWERVASGSALPRIHAILAGDASPRLQGPEIVERCGTDDVCRRAVETIRRYIGSVSGNIALTLMASGGLYLCGGVAINVFKHQTTDRFLAAFLDKGRMRPLLERVPVFVVNQDDLALRGAARTVKALFEPVPSQP